MTYEQATYLLNSFNKELFINANFLTTVYILKLNINPKNNKYYIELYINADGFNKITIDQNLIKKLQSKKLDSLDVKGFLNFTKKITTSFNKDNWYTIWENQIIREYKFKLLGI